MSKYGKTKRRFSASLSTENRECGYDSQPYGSLPLLKTKLTSPVPRQNHHILVTLRAYLRRSLKSPWREVESRLYRILSCKLHSSKEKRKILQNEVMQQTYIKDNKAYYLVSGQEVLVSGYYVHPISHLLSYQKPISRKEAKRQAFLNEKIELIEVGSIEYFVNPDDSTWYKRKVTKRKMTVSGVRWFKHFIETNPQGYKIINNIWYYISREVRGACDKEELSFIKNYIEKEMKRRQSTL